MVGQLLADLVGELADDRPDGLVGVFRHQRQIEADELLVVADELECLGAGAAEVGGEAVDLIVVDVAEALGEDKRKDVLLVFRGILRATNRTGGIPNPCFERFRRLRRSPDCHVCLPYSPAYARVALAAIVHTLPASSTTRWRRTS